MREDITGIRVVKALSKTEYEKRRFAGVNDAMTRADVLASTVMAVPGPFMQMLSLIHILRARAARCSRQRPHRARTGR